jgi:leader peptidase (prepilin peptidase)/N-methyltransferase
MTLLAIFSGLFGTLIGSFLNVVIYRVPLRKSIVSPPSACPNCGHEITALENVPLISWLALRGKCSSCKAPISVRYPLVEAGTAAFFVFVALVFAPPIVAASTTTQLVSAIVALVAFLVFAAVSVALALIDLDTRTLPNRIVLPALVTGIVLLTTASLLVGDYPELGRAAIGMVALFTLYFLLAVFTGGMGFGDVKLAAVVGLYLAWLGWGQLAVGALAAFVLGGLFGVVLIVLKRAGRKSAIPFGPWILAGAWVGVFAGQPVWNAYLQLSGLG